jgi:hypothetical protein
LLTKVCNEDSTEVDVKGIVYRNYHIVGLARLSVKSGYWIPKLRVLWRDAGREQKFELDGPPSRFRSKEEAEDYAVSMGKDWIDKKNPIP